jgi:hypothetical protein
MSILRSSAKVLGVDPKTIRNDLAKSSPENGEKLATQILGLAVPLNLEMWAE